MADDEALVAIYGSHAEAEDAVRRLHLCGYDVRRLSIVMQSYSVVERVTGFYTIRDRIRSWGKAGALSGGALGLLAGTALIVIPGIEAGAVWDSMFSWIRGALGAAAAIGGLGAAIAGAYSMILPRDSVLKFESEIEKNDKFLLMARSTAAEAAAARETLWSALPQELEVD